MDNQWEEWFDRFNKESPGALYFEFTDWIVDTVSKSLKKSPSELKKVLKIN